MVRSRFAPSPTGYLHLGHGFSALFAEARAREVAGEFLLRIEDIDGPRCREEYVDGILEDLAWLGVRWDGAVVLQSERMGRYEEALEQLKGRGLIYPCFCTRRQILEEVARAGGAPHEGESLYPGTCRGMSEGERAERLGRGEAFALRLDQTRAMDGLGELSFEDVERGRIVVDPTRYGDVVLARKDIGTSYHIAVVVDDAAQEISLVTRGMDLFESTGIHRILQELLGLPEPRYHHHGLIEDGDGKRLAKRDGAVTLRSLRESGKDPEQLRNELN